MMKRLFLFTAFALSACGPADPPDCDEDETLQWVPCTGADCPPDTGGRWVCVPKGEPS